MIIDERKVMMIAIWAGLVAIVLVLCEISQSLRIIVQHVDFISTDTSRIECAVRESKAKCNTSN